VRAAESGGLKLLSQSFRHFSLELTLRVKKVFAARAPMTNGPPQAGNRCHLYPVGSSLTQKTGSITFSAGPVAIPVISINLCRCCINVQLLFPKLMQGVRGGTKWLKVTPAIIPSFLMLIVKVFAAGAPITNGPPRTGDKCHLLPV
jgi:hypothetical protein